jgi:hypothetical protein
MFFVNFVRLFQVSRSEDGWLLKQLGIDLSGVYNPTELTPDPLKVQYIFRFLMFVRLGQ